MEYEILSEMQRAETFHNISQIDHILKRPEMYISSITKTLRQAKCFDSNKITTKDIKQPEGMEQIFLEILNNAAENAGSEVIEVSITSNLITVKNYGRYVPVVRNQDDKWIPSIIFGKLRTSRNYNNQDNFHNGIGAKAANIFSKEFSIECADSQNGLLFKQTWKNNMNMKCSPKVFKYKGPGYTQVSYSLNFDRFEVDKFDQEAIELYSYHCARISYIYSVPVNVNDQSFEIKSLLDFAKLFYPDNSSIYYKDPNGIYELCVVNTPNNAMCVSFVNGYHTVNGGIHTKAAYSALEKYGIRKEEVSLFISCHVPKPCFYSAMKDTLGSYDNGKKSLDIEIPEELLNNWR